MSDDETKKTLVDAAKAHLETSGSAAFAIPIKHNGKTVFVMCGEDFQLIKLLEMWVGK
jgi:hypothetical protein